MARPVGIPGYFAVHVRDVLTRPSPGPATLAAGSRTGMIVWMVVSSHLLHRIIRSRQLSTNTTPDKRKCWSGSGVRKLGALFGRLHGNVSAIAPSMFTATLHHRQQPRASLHQGRNGFGLNPKKCFDWL